MCVPPTKWRIHLSSKCCSCGLFFKSIPFYSCRYGEAKPTSPFQVVPCGLELVHPGFSSQHSLLGGHLPWNQGAISIWSFLGSRKGLDSVAGWLKASSILTWKKRVPIRQATLRTRCGYRHRQSTAQVLNPNFFSSVPKRWGMTVASDGRRRFVHCLPERRSRWILKYAQFRMRN